MIMADDEEGFPGLNKRHGFFKAIERNQRDRDDYHKKTEELRHETRRKRQAKNRKYPEQAIYRPPHMRSTTKESESDRDPSTSAGAYKLEIEVAPKKWHKEMINEVGTGHEVANSLKKRYGLTEIQRDAVEEMIKEFEASLKL